MGVHELCEEVCLYVHVFMCVCMSVWGGESEWVCKNSAGRCVYVCVCICVWERESEWVC